MNYSWVLKTMYLVVGDGGDGGMIWHFLQGLPLHQRLVHLEGEIQSSEEYSRKESQ